MYRLPPKERRALKYVKKNKIVPIHEFKYGLFRCEDLVNKEYLTKILITEKIYDDGYRESYGVSLSTKGEDVLALNRIYNKEARAALILSIISIAISFTTTFTPLADLVKEWLYSLFKQILSF